MFSAYMQEVIFKFYHFQFILLTFLFWAPHLHRKFQLQNFWSCALVWQCPKHNLITYTSYFCHTALKTFLFPLLAVHTQHFGCVTVTDQDRPTYVECYSCLLTYVIISSISFTRMNRESLCDISSFPLTFWRRIFFLQILAHPVFKT